MIAVALVTIVAAFVYVGARLVGLVAALLGGDQPSAEAGGQLTRERET